MVETVTITEEEEEANKENNMSNEKYTLIR